MSNIAPALARRIDRLARRAHAFHRHAHHPLCAAYEGEVLRLGRRGRLCLGCALLGTGAAAGAALGLALPLLSPLALTSGTGALLLLALRSVRPAPRRRGGKLLTRFLPMALASALLVAGARAGGAAGIAAAGIAAAAFALALAAYRRRGPDRSPCAACPERPAGPSCSGFREVARRERAFGRLTGRWLARARAGERRRPG